MKNSAKVTVALFALVLAVAPAFANAAQGQTGSGSNGGQRHASTIHDRSPRPHVHEISIHH